MFFGGLWVMYFYWVIGFSLRKDVVVLKGVVMFFFCVYFYDRDV